MRATDLTGSLSLEVSSFSLQHQAAHLVEIRLERHVLACFFGSGLIRSNATILTLVIAPRLSRAPRERDADQDRGHDQQLQPVPEGLTAEPEPIRQTHERDTRSSPALWLPIESFALPPLVLVGSVPEESARRRDREPPGRLNSSVEKSAGSIAAPRFAG